MAQFRRRSAAAETTLRQMATRIRQAGMADHVFTLEGLAEVIARPSTDRATIQQARQRIYRAVRGCHWWHTDWWIGRPEETFMPLKLSVCPEPWP